MKIEYLKALKQSDFLQKYDLLSDKYRAYESMEGIDKIEVQKIFDSLDISFKCYNKEYFFQHVRKVGNSEFKMHISPKYGLIETMFYKFEYDGEIFGGPLSRLQRLIALKVEGCSTPTIIRDPRFHSYENLKDVIVDLSILFDEFIDTLS